MWHEFSLVKDRFYDAIFLHAFRFQTVNPYEMNNQTSKNPAAPLMKAVKFFFSKLVKTNDEYPVKYYKRDKHHTRGRQQV